MTSFKSERQFRRIATVGKAVADALEWSPREGILWVAEAAMRATEPPSARVIVDSTVAQCHHNPTALWAGIAGHIKSKWNYEMAQQIPSTASTWLLHRDTIRELLQHSEFSAEARAEVMATLFPQAKGKVNQRDVQLEISTRVGGNDSGPENRVKGTPWSESQIQALAEDYRRLGNRTEVARRWNVKPQRVKELLDKHEEKLGGGPGNSKRPSRQLASPFPWPK